MDLYLQRICAIRTILVELKWKLQGSSMPCLLALELDVAMEGAVDITVSMQLPDRVIGLHFVRV